jgi:hypothetical protein
MDYALERAPQTRKPEELKASFRGRSTPLRHKLPSAYGRVANFAYNVGVTWAFSKLKENGAVELKEHHIVVKDQDALKGLAEAG